MTDAQKQMYAFRVNELDVVNGKLWVLMKLIEVEIPGSVPVINDLMRSIADIRDGIRHEMLIKTGTENDQ